LGAFWLLFAELDVEPFVVEAATFFEGYINKMNTSTIYLILCLNHLQKIKKKLIPLQIRLCPAMIEAKVLAMLGVFRG